MNNGRNLQNAEKLIRKLKARRDRERFSLLPVTEFTADTALLMGILVTESKILDILERLDGGEDAVQAKHGPIDRTDRTFCREEKDCIKEPDLFRDL